MTTPSTRIYMCTGKLSMHFNVEVKVRGRLCIAMKGSLRRSVPPVRCVRSRSCYGPLDCVRNDVLCTRYAATCWLTLLATVTQAVADKGPLLDGSACAGRK